MIIITALIYIAFLIYFYNSNDPKKKKIGKIMLIIFGVVFVLPVVAGLLVMATCMGVIALMH